MSKISHRAQDKLQALLNLLNRNWDDPKKAFALAYIDACATWFAGLAEGERKIADLALRAYLEGDEASAQKIAAAYRRHRNASWWQLERAGGCWRGTYGRGAAGANASTGNRRRDAAKRLCHVVEVAPN